MSFAANLPDNPNAPLALAPITLVRAGECVARGSVELRPIQGRGGAFIEQGCVSALFSW